MARCPTCINQLHFHCENKKCDWLICKACNYFGKPGVKAQWKPRLFGLPDSHG